MNGSHDIPLSHKEKLMLGMMIEAPCGARLYPIKMRQYEHWMQHKRAIIMRQSTLPAQFAVMPYLQAVFAIDIASGLQLGLIQSLRVLMSMATLQPLDSIDFFVSAEDQSRLLAICYKDADDKQIRIEPKDFTAIREIIAEQNGEKLPDESENPELVQAERDIASRQADNLVYDFETLLDSVSYASGKSMAEIFDMTVRSFNGLVSAIERDKMYTACLNGQMSGMVSFKNGLPCPSWCFDRKKEGNAALEPLSAFAARTGINPNIN